MLILAWCCASLAMIGFLVELSNLGEFVYLHPAPESGESVDLYVAMRDEESNAAEFLRATLAVPGIARLIVAQDGSQDATPAILATVCDTVEKMHVVTVPVPSCVHPSPKARALGQAIAAVPPIAEWLLFVDADVRLEAGAVGALIAFARKRRVGAVSAWPRVATPTLWSLLLSPTVTLFLTQVLPMRIARGTDPRFAAGNGQMFLISRQAYLRSGGHAALVHPVEDLDLARALKRCGTRIALASAAGIGSVRGYGSLTANLWGYGRSLVFGVGPVGCIAVALWQGAAFVAPFVFAAMGMTAGLVGVSAVLAARAVLAVRMRQSSWGIVLAPLTGLLAAAAALIAIVDRKRGRIRWRGRALR
ncbi:MAG: glycosyltransferase family 2 protein [Vulcanimicrobiaceae bacterium]